MIGLSISAPAHRITLRTVASDFQRLKRYVRATVGDFVAWITRSDDATLPPQRLRFVGAGDFEKVGMDIVDFLQTQAGIRSDSHVLDIGCGIGRVALPLSRFLDDSGRYCGFDPVARAIRWCRKHLTRSNFSFAHIDLHNSFYNRHGKVAGADFSFPYDDNSFDVVLASSVFTHTLPAVTKQYFRQAWRVLKPGGHLVASFFLFQGSSFQGGPFGFRPMDSDLDVCVADPQQPERVVAYPQDHIVNWLADAGFRDVSVSRGCWNASDPSGLYQDFVVCTKLGQLDPTSSLGMTLAVSFDRLNIGCGNAPLSGWCNIDKDDGPGTDVVLDVRRGLPFQSVNFVFAEHFIEHLSVDEAFSFLKECRRVLNSDGVLRLSTPNLDWVMLSHYAYGRWLSVEDAKRDCVATNQAFYAWGHRFLYNRPTLEALLGLAGFARVNEAEYGSSTHEELVGLERHPVSPDWPGLPHVIVLEAHGLGNEVGPLPQSIEDFVQATRLS